MSTHSAFRHAVLVHDTDEELDEAVRAFVGRGLESGAEVMVHGTRDRVDLMRRALEAHPRLTFGLDEELYREPTPTLFAYQRSLAARAETPGGRELWVTGTVPLGRNLAEQAAWHRYECAVDEALGTFPFVALCTYDARTRPDWVIAAALATHRSVNLRLKDRRNRCYVEPAAFFATPLAAPPEPPRTARPRSRRCTAAATSRPPVGWSRQSRNGTAPCHTGPSSSSASRSARSRPTDWSTAGRRCAWPSGPNWTGSPA